MSMSVQVLPPKMLQQLGERASRMDGCIKLRGSDIYEWAQGNNVVTIIGLPPVAGHVSKNKFRADEIRAALLSLESQAP
jgi:hypothetical protein